MYLRRDFGKIFVAVMVFLLAATGESPLMVGTSKAPKLTSTEFCPIDEDHKTRDLHELLLQVERMKADDDCILNETPSTILLIKEKGMKSIVVNQSIFVALLMPVLVDLSKFEIDPPVILLLPTQIVERK
ncbi:MAG: hypothetical protein LBJ36_11915 [Synergistaceae bacterium]|jgi:hypothetical protein|nr:hypothetical protein [Synergistaceae bacterium]